MANTRPLPSPDVPVIDPVTGRMTTAWYDYLRSRDQMKVADLRDVSTTAPANGEVLIFNTSNSLWEPGAN